MNKQETPQYKYFDFAVELIFLALVFLAPTVFDRRIGIVFSGTKTAVIRVLSLLILTAWSFKILIFREHKFLRSILDWPVVSYMLACTVATLTSVHVLVSFMGFYGRYEGLSTIYVWGLLFFVVTNFIGTKEQFRRIAMTSVTAATLMSIYGIIQRMGADPYRWGGVVTWHRIIATIGQPNFLAAYLLMAFFFGLAVLVMNKPSPDSSAGKNFIDRAASQAVVLLPFIGYLSSFILMIYKINTTVFPVLVLCWAVITFLALLFVFMSKDSDPLILNSLLVFFCLPSMFTAILFTQSRGGLLAFLGAGTLFMLLVKREALIQSWRKLGALALVLMIISGFTLIHPRFSPIKRFAEEVKVEEGDEAQDLDKVKEEKLAGMELKGAAGSRIETWKSAYRIIASRPFFGIGPEVLKMVFPRFETELFRFKEAFHVKQDRCHNEVFDVGVTKGLVSFLIYIWLIFLFYRLGLSRLRGSYDDDMKIYFAGILAAATSYFIQNIFSFGVVAISTLLWIMFGMIAVPSIRDDSENDLPAYKGISISDIPWLSAAAVLFALVVLWYLSTVQFRADRLYKSGKVNVGSGRFKEAIVDFRESLEISPYEGGTMTYYGITHLNVAQNVQDKRRWHELAIPIFETAVIADPYNADNYHILGKAYLTLHAYGVSGSIDRALEYTNNAIAIDPYYAEAYHNRGLIYETKGDLQAAAKEYETAFMINPNLGNAMQRYGAVMTSLGKTDEMLERFENAAERYPGFMPVLENLAISYSMLGRESDAIKVYNDMIKRQPRRVKTRVDLARTYVRVNDLDAAKSELQQVIIEDPTNVDAHNTLGLVYSKQGLREGAIKEFEQVLIIDSNNGYARNMLESLGAGK